MSTTSTRIVALAAVAAALGAAALNPAGSSARSETLRYAVHFSPFAYLDLGEQGPSAGDVITAHDRLLSGGKGVGRDALACTVTDPQTSALACQATFAVPGGTIATQSLGTQKPVKRLAITGGTGRYAGASGTATLVESGKDAKGNSVTFRFAG